MKQLIELAKTKPHWLPNEGYWRILQILRLMAFVPLVLAGIFFLFGLAIFEHDLIEAFGFGLLFLALGVSTFVAVHGIAWIIVWVIAGFSQTRDRTKS